jgi:alpha-L-rhamnosidase
VFRLDASDSTIFDAGLNDTGFVGLRVKCLKPGTVAVKFDEVLVKGEVSPTRYSCANVIAWEFTKPGVYAVESFEPYTLRYLDVIARGGAFEISAPYMRTFKNPKARKAKMRSSDKALMKIFEAARETYAQNAADVFTDCPGRERAGWLCDSFFTSRASLLFTGSLESEHLFLENFALPDSFDHLPDGMFAMCYPADFRNGNFIPNWAMWLAIEVEEFKKRGGDPKLVEAFRPKLVKLVDYLKTFRNQDGLLEKLPRWVFLEWSKANRLVQDVNYPSNMTWAEALDVMDRLYGMPELAEEARKVRETIRRQSWTGEWFCDNAVRQKDGTLKLSGECTETCQYYAFYFRTATPKSHPKLWKRLVDDFGPKRKETNKHPGIWPSNAFIGNYLRLECLSREGLSQQILDETRGFFLYMADLTGTLWENIETTASCNHGFASHVAVTYCRDVIGLKEVDHVNRTVVFSPPGELALDSISMNVPVGNGVICAGWKKVDGKVVESLTLPDGWRRLQR